MAPGQPRMKAYPGFGSSGRRAGACRKEKKKTDQGGRGGVVSFCAPTCLDTKTGAHSIAGRGGPTLTLRTKASTFFMKKNPREWSRRLGGTARADRTSLGGNPKTSTGERAEKKSCMAGNVTSLRACPKGGLNIWGLAGKITLRRGAGGMQANRKKIGGFGAE